MTEDAFLDSLLLAMELDPGSIGRRNRAERRSLGDQFRRTTGRPLEPFREGWLLGESIDSSRVLGTDVDMLIMKPSELIGDSVTVAGVFEDGNMLLTKMGRASPPFAECRRQQWYYTLEANIEPGGIAWDGWNYGIFAFDGGKIIMPRIRMAGKTTDYYSEQMATRISMALSAVEDCYRAGAWWVRFGEPSGVSFKVAVDHDAVKGLAEHRVAPHAGKSGRRAPMLHWVNAHLRRAQRTDVVVEEHTRGVDAFPLWGLDFQIERAPEPKWLRRKDKMLQERDNGASSLDPMG